MDNTSPSRKRFLQMLGLSAGATLLSGSALAKGISNTDIRMLNAEHQEFMTRYEKWMEEYLKVIRDQKTDPDNIENHKAMMALSQKAEAFKPELAEYMQDETFALVFRVTLEKMTNEIPT